MPTPLQKISRRACWTFRPQCLERRDFLRRFISKLTNISFRNVCVLNMNSLYHRLTQFHSHPGHSPRRNRSKAEPPSSTPPIPAKSNFRPRWRNLNMHSVWIDREEHLGTIRSIYLMIQSDWGPPIARNRLHRERRSASKSAALTIRRMSSPRGISLNSSISVPERWITINCIVAPTIIHLGGVSIC